MIKIYNRKEKSYEIEKVAGEKYLNWCYESPIGKGITELFVKRKLFSKLYGKYCDTKSSRKKIDSFVKDFNIDMNVTIKKQNEFESFNDFFARKLIPEARPFDKNKNILIYFESKRLDLWQI